MLKPASGNYTQGFTTAHQAVDIDNVIGTPVLAPEGGVVTFVGQMGSGTSNAGLVVQIGNPKGNAHRLCHLSKALVKVGQVVGEGQHVGNMGNSGYVIRGSGDGSHLHWICFRGGKRVDGSKLVNNQGWNKPNPQPTITIRPGVFNVRTGPGTNYPRTRVGGYVFFNQKFPLIAKSNGWAKINFRGVDGWIGPSAYR
jgi:murein DD-endopeptidase MepM/ murein hydrolase activator NlpD